MLSKVTLRIVMLPQSRDLRTIWRRCVVCVGVCVVLCVLVCVGVFVVLCVGVCVLCV